MSALAEIREPAAPRIHVPVMAAEVCALLVANDPRSIVDATVATGGHAQALLEASNARLIGVDRDPAALAIARKRLEGFGSRVDLHHADFSELDAVVDRCGLESIDAIIADLGMSSFALEDSSRGFSFRAEGPLDMRMDPRQQISAADIVNHEDEPELARILHEYGEERAARRIARAIAQARERSPISTTGQLRGLVERAVGTRRSGGIHPATRTFQALRIVVNRELESLAKLLERAPVRLAVRGRMAVISYHSLEDRAVKQRFRGLTDSGEFTSLTPKPMRAKAAEIARNPRARSARLRCVERAPK
jgi:16S rRNA (cytosine1402-N4)-methyltransferase